MQWYMSWIQEGMSCGYQNLGTCFRYSAHPLGVNEYDRAYAWRKGSAHGDTNTLCMDGCLRVPSPALLMLYPCHQEDADCTYKSIHICRRYSAHPLGVDGYDTSICGIRYHAIHLPHANIPSTDGCMCLHPA